MKALIVALLNVLSNLVSWRKSVMYVLLVTRGSIEPHYDWVVKMTINANPCPTWV